jgi:hypothetical protein
MCARLSRRRARETRLENVAELVNTTHAFHEGTDGGTLAQFFEQIQAPSNAAGTTAIPSWRRYACGPVWITTASISVTEHSKAATKPSARSGPG